MSKKIIVIDPGHGGSDPGAVNGARLEKNDNLRMALKMQEYFKAYDVECLLTRTTDKTVALNDRPNYANSVKADYFISVHRNSVTDKTAAGCEIWINSTNSQTPTQKTVATNINNGIVAVAKFKNRGVKNGYPGYPTSNFAINGRSNMDSSLVEIGFISNSGDNVKYDTEFNDIAKSIVDSIANTRKYPKVEVKPTPTPTPTPSGEIEKGDIVEFLGGHHYSSSSGTTATGGKQKAGLAKVTAIAEGAKHPYHLIHEDKDSDVYGWVDADTIKVDEPAPTPTPSTEIEKGDIVNFAGGYHYSSSTASSSSGGTRTAGTAKVTNISTSGKHPYHLVGETSNVYGWVDADLVSKSGTAPTPAPTPTPEPEPEPVPVGGKFKIGDKVVVNGTLYTSSTGSTKGATLKNHNTIVTRYAEGAKHPYNITGDMGWLDESSLSLQGSAPDPAPTPTPSAFEVGDIVRVKQGAKDQNSGKTLDSWVYNTDLQIGNLSGSKAGLTKVGSQTYIASILTSDLIQK